MTRKEKRKIVSENNFFGEFLTIKKHFFKELFVQLKSVKDFRQTGKVIYSPDILLFTIIMKNCCSIITMNGMKNEFNTNNSIENMGKAMGYEELEELPHYDTINNFLKKLDNYQLEKIRKYMIKELLKKRSLEHYRYNDKYWTIAIDGTGMFSFNKRHCEHCLKRTFKNKETGEIERVEYYHNVLEAKLVIGDMVFSIETEFIENEHEDVEKQDCERKAFYRLAEKLKKEYPRLPICILGDSLYACDRVFEICKRNRWRYVLRFKEGSIPSIAKEFKIIQEIEPKELNINEENENENTLKLYKYVNEIDYRDKKINMVEYKEQTVNKGDNKKSETSFVFITNIEISKKKVEKIVATGRSRWKIENEAFNNQKNISYDIEHACCLDYNAIKNHYLLIQIADILKQLFEKSAEVLRILKMGKKEISSVLKDHFRQVPLIIEDISTGRIQIRDL